jgi:hypothetical protein
MISDCFKVVLLSAILLAAGHGYAQTPDYNSSAEPMDSYSLEIDGKEYPVFTDRLSAVKSEKGDFQVKLKVAPFKTFSMEGISLEYPRHFSFEADTADKDVMLWNLSGSNTILMIQKYGEEMSHEIMGNMLQQRFGAENSKLAETEMELLGARQKGTRVLTTIGDSSITQDIFSFKYGKGSILLILQDSVDQQGHGSEEGTRFRETVSRTFKVLAEG